MAEKLEAAEASQDAFRSQVSSLKEVNAVQQEDTKSLWAELFEAGDKYDRLVEDSNMEKSTLQVQVLDLEVRFEYCPTESLIYNIGRPNKEN